MKNNYFLKVFFTIIIFSNYYFSNAQSLSAGDIAIIGVSVDNEDVLLVALKDIPANESVFITDDEWDTDKFRTGEGFHEWTTPSLTKGTVVTLSFNDNVASEGTLTTRAGSFALGNSGDGVFIYQTSNNLYDGTPTVIGFAGEDSGDSGSLTGSGLTIGVNAVYFGGDNGIYNDTRSGQSETQFLGLIYDSSKWATSGTAQTFDTTAFSFSTTPSLGFLINSSTANETDATFNISVPVSLSNYTADVTISVTTDASSTAESGDFSLNTSSLTFTGNETKNISLDINDDTDADNETIVLNIAITSGTADISISQHTITINDDDLPEIVISEIMYNSPTPGTDDEWIELYNSDSQNIDITNWTLEYNGNVFTFPSHTLNANNYIVIAVGSGGDGVFNADSPFIPDFNNLGVNNEDVKDTNNTNKLTNSSATITLKNTAGATVDVVTYDDGDESSTDGNGTTYEIINPSSNSSTTSTNWQASVRDGGSPGRASGAIWSGATDNNWTTATNWSNSISPAFTSDVLIPNTVSNYPTAASFIFTNSITFESGASLLFNSFVNGEIIYNRNVSSEWHLVASPIESETIESLISNNDFATGTGSNIGIGLYDNDNLTTPWQYQSNSSTGSIASGIGISVKLNTSPLVFKGNMYTSADAISVSTGSRNDFNLVGNRYTGYLDSDLFLTNISNTPVLAEQTIWLWNGTEYITKNMADPIKIAPTQGFFIKAGITADVAINPAMLTHNNTNTFLRQSPKSSFELFTESDNKKSSTKVFYIDGKTKGFDNGFDSRIFGGVENNFAVYTELLNNNDGRKLAIQTLPNQNYDTMVIPVGLTAEAGKKITFSVLESNLPTGIDVYLEDRKNNLFINLSENNHVVTLQEAANGMGQFYVHTTASRLNNEEFDNGIQNISIYSSANKELNINGLQTNANLQVFSLLGEELVETKIVSGNSKVNLSTLANGIYIVKLNTESGNITKKIILEN
ncbi:lamin tail domain-containing protein [Tenacibaculum jejuense]|uniref:LTD domain-containing protein n=1 Tax=Tenacibaculum jejuense TaxID=584609 RepID=A0A238UC91_9FLAO|nr:lamin tail domain-containing protein [Tenacibaculum jejuense]SNR16675.1 Protein of unknown function precursor containing a C-terminal secretion signal [Tenacibaculum jejuense]